MAGPKTDAITVPVELEMTSSGLNRPSITPAQLVAGIPILAEFGHAFGLYTLSGPQQDSLTKVVTWAFVLIGGDAIIRFGRNLAHRA